MGASLRSPGLSGGARRALEWRGLKAYARRMRVFATICMLCPALASAEGWTPLSGDEIRAALEDRRVAYASAWQEFRASGRTLYNAGQDSWGYWRIEGNRYCSQWPPSDLWACYGLEQKGDKLRFVGSGDDITEGTYAE